MQASCKDVYRLAYELYKTGSTKKARDPGFKPVNILHKSIEDSLYEKIEKFNDYQCLDGYFDDLNTISIDDMTTWFFITHSSSTIHAENQFIFRRIHPVA